MALFYGSGSTVSMLHFQTIIFKKSEIFQISYGSPALRIYQNLTNFYSHKKIAKDKVFPVHCNFNFYKKSHLYITKIHEILNIFYSKKIFTVRRSNKIHSF